MFSPFDALKGQVPERNAAGKKGKRTIADMGFPLHHAGAALGTFHGRTL
jgi:hypothetical protein